LYEINSEEFIAKACAGECRKNYKLFIIEFRDPFVIMASSYGLLTTMKLSVRPIPSKIHTISRFVIAITLNIISRTAQRSTVKKRGV
jgi:hypothetical protein